MENKRILIIRFSSLGDVILTSGLIKLTKTFFPDSEIDFLTRKEYSDIVSCNPHINEVIYPHEPFNFGSLKKLKEVLYKRQYDLVLDAHNNLRTRYLRMYRSIGWKTRVLKKYSLRKFLLVKFKLNYMKHLPPVAERYMQLLGKIPPGLAGYTGLTGLPELNVPEESNATAAKKLLKEGVPEGNPIIVVSPASKHFTKTYPAEKYAELFDKIGEGYSIVLTGSDKDMQSADKLSSLTKYKLYNLCGRLTLSELAAVIKRASVFISGDTGPMHMAEALGTPLIMLAGSSVKEFGFYPLNANSVVLENNNLSCRPCSHIGRASCPKGHFKCMNEITAEEIYSQFQNLVK